MISSPLIQRINHVAPLSKELEECIVASLKEEEFCKRDLLLKEGQIARQIYFIQKGFCRAFYSKEDKEYTTWFMGEGDIMISVYSFFTQRPSVESIEVLQDATFLSMSWQQLQKIYHDFPEFNLFGRIITEQYYIKSEERAIALRTLSAKDRYENLLKTYPNILQKASLGQIASHLGMNLETLSRIRAKVVF
ncbi:MAG: Crp/Fnr family transcriptional regulator [Mucilaginibacter sp.]|uniref:Crp/Fnr family transcriptional regulator n=1 Tax=Mucilaginibacter sp. TaxID=1882438 RepID=UPI0034E4033C